MYGRLRSGSGSHVALEARDEAAIAELGSCEGWLDQSPVHCRTTTVTNGPHRLVFAGMTEVEQSRAIARAKGKAPRQKRGALTQERIVEAACELIDLHGLGEFSMPALAKKLDYGVTSIYWHFRSKDDLMTAVAEHLSIRVHDPVLPPPARDVPWFDAYRDLLVRFRSAFGRSRTYVEVFMAQRDAPYSGAYSSVNVMRKIEEALELLTSAGFTPDEALRIYVTCIGYVRGFVIHERGWLTQSRPTSADEIRTAVVPDPALYPLVSRVTDLELATRYDDQQFALGLDFLITGIRQRAAELERAAPDAR